MQFEITIMRLFSHRACPLPPPNHATAFTEERRRFENSARVARNSENEVRQGGWSCAGGSRRCGNEYRARTAINSLTTRGERLTTVACVTPELPSSYADQHIHSRSRKQTPSDRDR